VALSARCLSNSAMNLVSAVCIEGTGGFAYKDDRQDARE
jgi:hypothetical protein